MDKCYESETLVQWLNGQLNESRTNEIRDHVTDCHDCQLRLEELTDEESLRPPSNPDSLLDGSTFTNEPHFRSLRETLTRKVLTLDAETKSQKIQERDIGPEPQGSQTDFDAAAADTVEANAGLTESVGEETHVDTFTLAKPILIEGYRLESLIGRGGFAEVYSGWDTRLERTVAIKVLDQNRIDARNRHRFLREAKVASSIESENVVRVMTSGETDCGRPFIVMEFVKGETLSQWIDSLSGSPTNTAIEEGIEYLIQICNGIQTVHDSELIHRDIKPSNIFIDSETQLAKLGDFGLARVLNTDTVTLTRAAELAGTPAYMSPEQTKPNNDVGPLADVYSLGATLYHVLTGQPPFRGSSLAILTQVNETIPTSPRQLNEAVTKDLETICLKALEKEPHRRYSNAKLLAEDLQRVIDGQPIAARPVGRVGKIIRWANSNRPLAISLGLLSLALILGTIISTSLWQRSEFNSARLSESRLQLIASVKTMVSSNLKRKSTYMDMSGDDRTRAVKVVADTYRLMFETRIDDDIDLMRELAWDLSDATEVNLELSAYSRAGELMETNWLIVDELMSMDNPSESDRVVTARFHNQLSEFMLNHKSISKDFQAGNATWKTIAKPGSTAKEQALESLEKVIAITIGVDNRASNLGLQQLQAMWRLLCLDEPSDENTQKLLTMLDEVAEIRQADLEMSADWMTLHQRMLKQVAKVHKGDEAVAFRRQRSKVFKDYIDELNSKGEETYWYERDNCVNDFYTALALLRAGKPDDAKTLLDEVVVRFERLVAEFPGNSQFGADLAEASLVVAEMEWGAKHQDAAVTSYERTLNAFENILKGDSGEISVRRRAGVVFDIVGQRYLAMENFVDAARCFSSGSKHFLVVFNAPYDEPAKEQDKAMHELLKNKAADAIAKTN